MQGNTLSDSEAVALVFRERRPDRLVGVSNLQDAKEKPSSEPSSRPQHIASWEAAMAELASGIDTFVDVRVVDELINELSVVRQFPQRTPLAPTSTRAEPLLRP